MDLLSTLTDIISVLLRLVLLIFTRPRALLQLIESIEEIPSAHPNVPDATKPVEVKKAFTTDLTDLEPRSEGPGEEDYIGSADSPVSLPPHRRKHRVRTPAVEAPSPDSAGSLKRRFFESLKILSIDIGGTRTKFMFRNGSQQLLLPPTVSQELWRSGSGLLTPRGHDALRKRLAACVTPHLPVPLEALDFVVFSVPGTVEIPDDDSDAVTVRNMPSFSLEFRGFNFKTVFAPLFPAAKINAVADNLAAAMGAACRLTSNTCGLVLVLGTAPAVATFFRSPKNKSLELAIWQSWAWFTKIGLNDPYGYCGGLRIRGEQIELKDKNDYKIPHPKARIRFALDAATWKRLRGKLSDFPQELQGNLNEEDATKVWAARVQSAVDALALRFHQVYGRPQIVVVLGGNAIRCKNLVQCASYSDPDINRAGGVTVPVFIPSSDEDQQRIHLGGLAHVAAYKRTHVYAPGPDPLARGWTRGGEIYLWVKRNEII